MTLSCEDSCLNLAREDWTRSGDLETQELDDNNNIHSGQQPASWCPPLSVSLPNADVVPPEAKPVMTGDFCPDLCKPVDLKTQSEEFVQKLVMMAEFYPPHLLSFHIVRVGCPVWEKPVDLKMQKEMKTVGTVVNADPETRLQQEEEPDFCRQDCVKEDGEE
ncbi:hypothetical protein Bbelb_165120 [Branchiostoma belcheri]|nr:hypothetical protein Bbelb_165120 [Branchiostoma belcheri]